ncbi:F-box protein SKIP23 [Trifolium pratense]|uniref:F-box protein SKIP23 n=1 Tax=Trifolium pratense TaxID=57577 RepID=A0A2K3L550_TRIPR|nr:F-box protein SKIP23 [Trifolium pratense]
MPLSMAVATNWSELPKDLLDQIWERLDNEIDLIRFRSICSHWRSSSIPNRHSIVIVKFPLPKNILPDLNIKTSFCHLSKRKTFLIKPPPQQTLARPWLMRITQISRGKNKLIHPLFSYDSPSTNFHLPQLIDFNKLSVLHLVTDFILDDEFCSKFDLDLPKKVISVEKQSLVLGVSQNSVLFRSRNQRWRKILNFSTTDGDICVFKERFYAVDRFGTTFMVRPDSTVELVAELDDFGGNRKLFVESEGELLLVDMHMHESSRLRIEVFKLCEKEKKWIKLKNLARKVLFLGHGCSFSASTLDLGVSKGNCVIFIDDAFLSFMDLHGGKCVFHLDQGRLSPMSHYPEYFDLFWPPPDWIFKS